MQYDREAVNLQRISRENYVTGMERLQQIMKGMLYNSVIKHIQFLTNNDTCMRKQIQEILE